MKNDKITVVSGEPRSGTSMMMQTIKILGLDIAGEEYPQEKKIEKQIEKIEDKEKKEEVIKNTKTKLEHAHKMNPHGFYEVPGLVMQGVTHMRDEFKNKVIKIITNGVYEREMPNGHKIGTPSEYIDKIIMCLRNPKHIAISQKDLSGNVEIAGVDDKGIDQWINAPQPLSPKRYIQSMGGFIMWVAENRELDDKIMMMDYEDMHKDKPIEKIADFLGVDATPEQIQEAKDNIDPLLNRSTNFEGWGDKDIEGLLAEKIYDALKAWDIKAFADLACHIKEMIDNDMREGVRWVDTEHGSWVTITPSVFRSGKQDPLHPLLIPMANCKYFGKDTEHKYTIERPVDIGDLERSMVKCSRDDNSYTCEYCKHCWQRGSFIDSYEYEGQRHRDGKPLVDLTDNEIEHRKEQE